jgi:tetratricopeptide (TPR) repeat protein
MVLGDRQRRVLLWLCLFLIVSIIAVYIRTVGFDFVDYDDPLCVSGNPEVMGGLRWDSIKWAFTTAYRGNWIPLTWLSLMVDAELFGANAAGFHIVNVTFHIANTVLLFLVLRRYSKVLWPSFFVAAFFGLHPLHVESVAWVTERKDVLSTLFWMLTMLAYVQYTAKPTVRRYVTMIILYALGLMAKPMLVTLPFVLLVMDYWPLQRLYAGSTAGGVSMRRLILEKAPLFVLSVVSSVVAFFAQKSGGAMSGFSVVSFGQRIGNAFISYCNYILKMFWPVRLAALYPYSKEALCIWKVIAAVVVLLAVTAIVILLRRRRYLLAGWLWYVGTLVPVIGFVQVGAQSMADRYTYVPLTGIFIMLTWLAGDIVGKWRYKTVSVCLAGSVLISVLGILTFRQVGYWRDSVTLFSRASSVTADDLFIRERLGTFFAEKGDIDSAMREFEIVLKADPNYFFVRRYLGILFTKKGDFDSAMRELEIVLKANPDDFFARSYVAMIFAEKGDLDSAMREFEIVLKANPRDVETLCNIGRGLTLQGNTDRAIEYYNRVLAIVPGHSDAYYALASIQAKKGQFERAIDLYRDGIRCNPQDGRLHGGLGSLFLQTGRVDEALIELQQAVKLKEDSAVYVNLGAAELAKGNSKKAIEHFERAVQLNPANAVAHYNLGNGYLSQARLTEAVGQYKEVIRINPKYAKAYSNLAAAFAQMGRLDEAVENFRRVVELEPNNADAYFNLAETLANNGLSNEAIENLRRTIELSPRDIAARCRLAELLLRMGRVEEAVTEYQNALKIDPDNADAQLGLKKAKAY